MTRSVDVDKILEQILTDPRIREGRAFSSRKTYSDEPILRRGSQMSNYTPDMILQMRNVQRSPEARMWSDSHVFVEQGRLMADYEDNYDFHGTFNMYFPTYRSMNNQQLRGYFSWRTNVRHGLIAPTCTSFVYVYLYELLNSIGVEPGEKGFEALWSFWQTYRQHEPAMDRYVREWLQDYAAWHGLDQRLVARVSNGEHDAAIEVLDHAEKAALAAVPKGSRAPAHPYGADPDGERDLLAAMNELSTYRIMEQRLYKDHPDDLARVCHGVFARLARHYRGTRSQGLTESLFGMRFALNHVMFASAIFYTQGRHDDGVYELSPTRRYECKGGRWTVDSFHDGGATSTKLGQLLRLVDRRLRDALDYPHPLKERNEPQYLVKLVDAEIRDYMAWRETHKPVVIEIDLSKLAGIRDAAAVTREALLVDEEREINVGAEVFTPSSNNPVRAEVPPAPPAHAELRAEQKPPHPYDLTDSEADVLAALLNGNDGDISDLVVDAINEKLFDVVGDTVIEFGADGAQIIEDYIDDVREILQRN